MYLSPSERRKIVTSYGYDNLIETAHYQVETDTWVYLFCDHDNKKYILIVTDCLDDFEFDHFPHLLRFDNDDFYKTDFILQDEIDSTNPEKTANSVLFLTT